MRFWFFFLLSISIPAQKEDSAWHIQGRAQGTTYHISYYAPNQILDKSAFDSLFNCLDSSLSLYNKSSVIHLFNLSTAGTVVDEHFINVYRASRAASKSTKGLFDITVKPLLQLWGFGPQPGKQMPDSAAVFHTLDCVGSEKLKLKRNFLRKKKACVQVDMNGIAQGYSVDLAAALLESAGITDYIVELGGEIRVSGSKPGGKPFVIGIESPGNDPFNEALESKLSLSGGALTTSGSYRQYREYNGKQYAHLINPKTGYPVENELISVTVYAKDAMTADAYDNALMLMGLEKAMAFVEKEKNMAAYFIFRNTDGQISDTASSRFYPLLNP